MEVTNAQLTVPECLPGPGSGDRANPAGDDGLDGPNEVEIFLDA